MGGGQVLAPVTVGEGVTAVTEPYHLAQSRVIADDEEGDDLHGEVSARIVGTARGVNAWEPCLFRHEEFVREE
jgi:hypothetical protein